MACGEWINLGAGGQGSTALGIHFGRYP
jgi:hypothetical protein